MSQSSPSERPTNDELLRELVRLLAETAQARQAKVAQENEDTSPLALINYPFDVRADVLDLKTRKPVSRRQLRREIRLLNRIAESLAGHVADDLYGVLAPVLREPRRPTTATANREPPADDEQRLAALLDNLQRLGEGKQENSARVSGLYVQLDLHFREGSLIIAGALTILVVKSLLPTLGLGALSGIGSFAMQRILTRVLGAQLERNGMQITINGPATLISGNVATGNMVRGALEQSSAGSGIAGVQSAGGLVRARSLAALGVALLGVLGVLVSVGTLIIVVLIASHLGIFP